MSRRWDELLLLDGIRRGPVGAEDEAEEAPRFLIRLRQNLARTREALGAELQATVAPSDDAGWERLEETLIAADVGAAATVRIVERLELAAAGGRPTLAGLAAEVEAVLAGPGGPDGPRIDLRAKPAVVLVVGVNGTGKTTTIGKLAWHLRHGLGATVLVAAADTYRAAATEQLEEWARRADADVVRAQPGADPGAVAYDAIDAAAARGHDVVIVDTAGRVHTRDDLMGELGKVRRVIEKRLPGAPHETLLTVDATTGQNGVRQAQLFHDAVGVSGIALTKLDGSAKGGIAVAIAEEVGIPVKLAGVGEALEDLRPFDPGDFARALAGE